MSMTILGIGNSTVDLFVDRELSVQGLEILALTGLIGGQMFNFLVGFGLSEIKSFFIGTEDQQKFSLFSSNLMKDKGQISVMILLLTSLLTLIFLFGQLQLGK